MSRVHRRLLLVAVAGLTLGGGALAAGWDAVREERRLGRVEHAALPFTLTIPHLDVERTIAASAPGVRSVSSLVATSAVVTRPDTAGAGERSGLDALREQVLGLTGLDGALTLRIRDIEVRGRDGTYRLDVTGEKTPAGAVTLALTLAPAGQPPALRVGLRATAAGRTEVDVRVDLAGEPPRLGALWPAALPAPASIVTRSEVRLQEGGGAAATGRLTMAAAVPAVLDFTARYDGATAGLDVARWALTQGDLARLTGTLRAEPAEAGVRVVSTARGTVDGAQVDGHARYEGGAFGGEVSLEPVSAAAVARRLGLGTPPVDVRARAVRTRFAGTDDGGAVAVTVDAVLEGMQVPGLAPVPIDGALGAAVRLVRGAAGLGLGPLERAVLALTHAGVQVTTISARSRGAALWPLRVEAQVSDAAAVVPLLPQAVALTGSGRIAGEAEAVDGPLRFRGVLDADLPGAQLTLGTPVALSGVRATSVPVHWNAGGAERPGSVTVARLGTHGLAVDDVTGSATLIDGLLRLPDLRYRHYDGHGSGWVEIAVGGQAAPLRARLEGERVDLAALVRETGSTLAQVTGRVRYTGSLQQLPGRGVDAVAQLRSQEGGEIGIEAIEALLDSAAVEVESTGLLRQTLESLRVFEYESLDGELRAADGQGTVDLSIRGRRRLGLFPAPVQAINLRNVPLDVLRSTLDRGTSR